MNSKSRPQHFLTSCKSLVDISFFGLNLVDQFIKLIDFVIAAFVEFLFQILQHGFFSFFLLFLYFLSELFLIVAFLHHFLLMSFEDVSKGDEVEGMECIDFLADEFKFSVEVRDSEVDRLDEDAVLDKLRLYFLDFVDELNHR